MRKLVKDLGLTAIHVTHDQEEALSISDRIVVMKAGRIVEIGQPQEIYMNPKELFTAKFLGEANFLTGIINKLTNNTCRVHTCAPTNWAGAKIYIMLGVGFYLKGVCLTATHNNIITHHAIDHKTIRMTIAILRMRFILQAFSNEKSIGLGR